MWRQFRKTSVAVAAGAALVVGFVGTSVGAQKLTAADVAAKFTGTWKLNKEESPTLNPAGSGGGARRSGATPLREVGFAPVLQGRGGGGRGGGGDAGAAAAPQVSMADAAGNAAIKALQGLAENMTIKATADSITFIDPRGERTYPVTGKNAKIDVGGGAQINANSKWDKLTLKQQFFYGETQINQNWELNDAGNRINFKMQILNAERPNDPPREAKVVYDRQP